MAEARTLEDPLVRVTLVEDEGPQAPPLVEEEDQIPHLGVTSRVKRTVTSTPSAGSAETNENPKKRNLTSHYNGLQAARVDVKFL